jgi:lipopolysaccharide/colanic/teichoic acid biosynthesis glycosyltransferase
LAAISIAGWTIRSAALGWRAIALAERGAAALALAALAPGMACVALATAALSRRAPLILHRRVGYLGATLWMVKFRTMWDGGAPARRGWLEFIHDDGGPAGKRPGDARVTSRFAAFCRRHSIDELPQLWHVVTGEMALIGPRPLTAREIRDYYPGDAEELLSVKPGIAGLWQTSGRARLSYAERRALDLAFVRQRSIRMYLQIARRSLTEILRGANTW